MSSRWGMLEVVLIFLLFLTFLRLRRDSRLHLSCTRGGLAQLCPWLKAPSASPNALSPGAGRMEDPSGGWWLVEAGWGLRTAGFGLPGLVLCNAQQLAPMNIPAEAHLPPGKS